MTYISQDQRFELVLLDGMTGDVVAQNELEDGAIELEANNRPFAASFFLSDETTFGDLGDIANTKLHCYPNPLSDELFIDLQLSQPDLLDIAIYDLYGKQVLALFEGEKAQGQHRFRYSLDDLPNSLYLVKIQAASGTQWVKRVTVTR